MQLKPEQIEQVQHRHTHRTSSSVWQKDHHFLFQGSRVRPIWSHVRPNFSRVRQKKNVGRTGASSHLQKKKKKSLRDSKSLLFDNRHVRLISWSKPIRDSEVRTPPSDWPWSRYSCMCVCVWRCVCCCSQRERWVVEMHAALSLNLICSVSVWQSLQDSAIAEFIAKSCKLRYFPNCCRFCS